MGGSKLTSERRHSIASVITGSFLFSENQAEISMATKLSFFFPRYNCMPGLRLRLWSQKH